MTHLSPSQLRAVDAPAGRVLILAGAGSGKTHTLTFRAARLVERGSPPEGLILATFSVRAAREIVSRLEVLLGAVARKVRAGTFHGLAHRTLRAHGHALGLRTGFTILDRDDQDRGIERAIEACGFARATGRFPSGAIVGALRSYAVSTREALEMAIQSQRPELAPREAELIRVLETYGAMKRAMNAVDFDDLLLGWRELLTRDDPLGATLRGEVAHVLVDEYQDTNALQAEIAERLASTSGSLTVVGDDAQCIYSFRGARFENILDFPRRAKTEVHALTQSYRSTPEILAVANACLERNRLQFPKTLESVRAPGPLPIVVRAEDPREQAAFIAQRALELSNEGIPLSEQVVLHRAASHTAELELELTRRDIPFVLRSGVRFLDRAHVRDALAFLRVIANPSDLLGWARILGMLPQVGKKTAARMLGDIERRGLSGAPDLADLADLPAVAEIRPGGRSAIEPLFGLLLRLDAERAHPRRFFETLLAGTRAEPPPTLLVTHVNTTYEDAPDRLAELAELAIHAESERDVLTFLGDTVINGAPAEEGAEGRARLTLSTVHQAKGLEWSAAFVMMLNDGRFPIQSALEAPEGEAEERRLFHVAVTRAKDQLYLTYPASRRFGTERALLRPSRFLEELECDPPRFERWVLDSTL